LALGLGMVLLTISISIGALASWVKSHYEPGTRP
jgi:hypothetical protein